MVNQVAITVALFTTGGLCGEVLGNHSSTILVSSIEIILYEAKPMCVQIFPKLDENTCGFMHFFLIDILKLLH